MESAALPRQALIIGDCLSIVRYGAAQGLLKSVEVQAILEEPLNDLAASGWENEWAVVDGRHNQGAHDLAAAGLARAISLAHDGNPAQRTLTTWSARAAPDPENAGC
jgi:hypothetical protein